MTESRPLTATYRLKADSADHALERALAIAREQTIEVPPGVGGAALQDRLLGRVEEVRATASGRFDAEVSYSLDVTGTGLLQVVNVAYGNVSLMNGVRLVDLVLPTEITTALPGPRIGIQGMREMVGAEPGRPLVSVAIKPVGRSTDQLAGLARTFVQAGVDVIKDDHGLVDQPSAPFVKRVEQVGRVVAETNAEAGRRCAYFPNVTGPVDTLPARLDLAVASGCAGVMLCPSLMGLDVMRFVAAGDHPLAIMAHPAHAQSAPGREEGMAPDVLFGTLYRAAGADVVVYVNAAGRFGWSIEECEAINARLRAPLGTLRRSFPAPAGGVDMADAGRWYERYGPDTMLLIGGSLLARDDLLEATRSVVRAAYAASASHHTDEVTPRGSP